MKTFSIPGAFRPFATLRFRFTFLLIIWGIFQYNTAQSQTCASCCVSSFPALTIYQVTQTNHGLGFGIEAGSWNKAASKFSYFIGTSMVWAGNSGTQVKSTVPQSKSQTLLSFYVKGQYKISNHLYVVAAPAIVNLTYLELQAGLRYVIPVTKSLGLGIEPAYAFNQRQMVLNLNMHIALR